MRSKTSARCGSTTPGTPSSRAPASSRRCGTLRERGFRVGLITVCSEDVEVVFPETELAGLFDAEVFSNAVRLAKPDPRIYVHCCELLGVEPHEAVFVGDGANDELDGARRVGMEAILIHRDGEEPLVAGPAGLGRSARHLDSRCAGRASAGPWLLRSRE